MIFGENGNGKIIIFDVLVCLCKDEYGLFDDKLFFDKLYLCFIGSCFEDVCIEFDIDLGKFKV